MKANFYNDTQVTEPEIEVKKIDVQKEIADFAGKKVYGQRVVIVEEEVEKYGTIYIALYHRKDGEMQTNRGYVVGVGDECKFVAIGDRVTYGRYSGTWIDNKKYRLMNEEDIFWVEK